MPASAEFDLGKRIEDGAPYALLRHVLAELGSQCPAEIKVAPRPARQRAMALPVLRGCALEFGVGRGYSLRLIAATLPVVGFDSFQGLPEDWRPGFPRGTFRAKPPVVPNARLVVGLYEGTLPGFDFAALPPLSLVHVDCDLYSSTRTVLAHVMPHLIPGSVIVFDEFHGYPGADQHEQRAWREWVDAHPGLHDYSVIGHSGEQWAVQLT